MNDKNDARPKGCRLPTELLELKKFHGHLGPYAVFGYRMGQIARVAFPQKIHATVFSGTKRPRSCMADGVQMASCCTLGKNNIAVVEGNEARAIFTDGNATMEIAVLPELVSYVDSHMSHETEEELSLEMFLKGDDSLFMIKRSGREG